MEATIDRGIRNAWRIGLEKAGILESEMTIDEIAAINEFVANQYRYLGGFADDIEAEKKGSGKLGGFLMRSDMWVNAFDAAIVQAFAMAAGNKKLVWVLGEAEHCSSCSKLAGKVKRDSYWTEKGILPKVQGVDYLDCHGYRCQCDLIETDEPLSKGPLPSLP